MSERGGFRVQAKPCATCIYRKDMAWDIDRLEAEVADGHGSFHNHRTCHHSTDVCCRGFWNRHKDKYWVGQLAQRMDAVIFVDVDIRE